MKIGFDNEKYIKMQSEKIMQRINDSGKLYLEFGGKLFDDFHASRVLPGFAPDVKIQMLSKLSEKAEIIIVISSEDIETNKIREDIGIPYKKDILRLIDAFASFNLYVSSVVVTKYNGQTSVNKFIDMMEKLGIRVYKHYKIEGYPSDIQNIVSENGFGKNEYIKTTKPLVVVTAPGPGSGKMATCLSQLYHDNKNGIKAGYSKFETFPVWNLPLNHPVNIAYEAATVDLDDVNMIDPFHLETYNQVAINYNRDVEIFPVLKAMLDQIMGKSPYNSPTDMGVNMVGYCIKDGKIIEKAAKDEIIRRYYKIVCDYSYGKCSSKVVAKSLALVEKAKIHLQDTPLIKKCLAKANKENKAVVAIELEDGRVITGKSANTITASVACVINALKTLAQLDDKLLVIPPTFFESIETLKDLTHDEEKRISLKEALIAISINSLSNPLAKQVLDQIPNLRGLNAHSSVILDVETRKEFKNLGIYLSMEGVFEDQKFYHK